MNFFNDIGRAFQTAGEAINNEVVKPSIITLDPKNTGFTNTFDPHKSNFKMTFDPNQNGVNNNFKIALDKLENKIAKPFEKDVIKPFDTKIIKPFEKDVIQGFEKRL